MMVATDQKEKKIHISKLQDFSGTAFCGRSGISPNLNPLQIL